MLSLVYGQPYTPSKLTEEAIQKGKEQREAKIAEDTMDAAREGKKFAEILSTDGIPYCRANNNWDTATTWGLRHYYVEKMMREEGLAVSVVNQHDGAGMRGWEEIRVTF